MGEVPQARTALVHLEAEPRGWLAKAAANGTQIYADVGWDPTRQWSPDLLGQLSLCHAFLPNETEAMAYRAPTARSRRSARSPIWCRSPSSPAAAPARSRWTRRRASTRTCPPSTSTCWTHRGRRRLRRELRRGLPRRLAAGGAAAVRVTRRRSVRTASRRRPGRARLVRRRPVVALADRPRSSGGVRIPHRPPAGRPGPTRPPRTRHAARSRAAALTPLVCDTRTDPKGGGSSAALTKRPAARGPGRYGRHGARRPGVRLCRSDRFDRPEHGPVVLGRGPRRHGPRQGQGALRRLGRPAGHQDRRLLPVQADHHDGRPCPCPGHRGAQGRGHGVLSAQRRPVRGPADTGRGEVPKPVPAVEMGPGHRRRRHDGRLPDRLRSRRALLPVRRLPEGGTSLRTGRRLQGVEHLGEVLRGG